MTEPTYAALVAENADLRDQVAKLTEERDALQEQLDADDYNRRAQRRLRRLGLQKTEERE